MKRIAFLLGASALLAIAAWAQFYPPPPLPMPPLCHDQMICTEVYGCRWVTICN